MYLAEYLCSYRNIYPHSKICLQMDRGNGTGDSTSLFRYHKHSHGSESDLIHELSTRLCIFYVVPRVIDIACNFCTRKVDHSYYIIKAVAIFALNCITNKKQIQHNIYCFGTISVTYGWAYLWQIFVSVFHYEFTI